MSEVLYSQQYYQHYQNPQVRALVWSLLSPSLSIASEQYPHCVPQSWCEQIYAHIKEPLQQLDQQPQPLLDWLKQYPSWRLGIRFEAYWAYILHLLQANKQILSWASHIQINSPSQDHASKVNNGQTLGELDFVYLDAKQHFYHLELAVKFYLLKPDEFGYERLIGPNGQDWYERKLVHLFRKQLALSKTPQCQEKLSQLDAFKQATITDIQCQPYGLIKGMIFFPVTGEAELNEHEQVCINPQAETGLWATRDNWYLADPGQVGRWVILEKLNWLVPQVYREEQDEFYTFKEMDYKIKIHFHATKRSMLIARLEYDEQRQLWMEQQRIMVVDQYWPSYKEPNHHVAGKKVEQQSGDSATKDNIIIEGVPVNA